MLIRCCPHSCGNLGLVEGRKIEAHKGLMSRVVLSDPVGNGFQASGKMWLHSDYNSAGRGHAPKRDLDPSLKTIQERVT